MLSQPESSLLFFRARPFQQRDNFFVFSRNGEFKRGRSLFCRGVETCALCEKQAHRPGLFRFNGANQRRFAVLVYEIDVCALFEQNFDEHRRVRF